MIVADYAPISVLVQLVEEFVITMESALVRHAVVDDTAGDVLRLRLPVYSAYLDEAEALVSELRLIGKRAVGRRDVGVGAFGRAQVRHEKLVGILRVENLGVTYDDGHALLSREADPQLAHHVLTHVDDEAAVRRSPHALGAQLLLYLHAGARLRLLDALRRLERLRLLPAAVVEIRCRPVLHLEGSLVAFAVPEVVALYGAVRRDLPIAVRYDGKRVLDGFDDELRLEARQAV